MIYLIPEKCSLNS